MAGEAPALHGGVDEHGELALAGGGVAYEAGDAMGVGGGFVDGDEGHLAVVVDLGHAGDLLGREFAEHVEEAVADVLGGQAAEQGGVGLGVLGADGADEQGGAAAQGDAPGEFGGVGGDGVGGVLAGGPESDPGVGGGNAMGVGK